MISTTSPLEPRSSYQSAKSKAPIPRGSWQQSSSSGSCSASCSSSSLSPVLATMLLSRMSCAQMRLVTTVVLEKSSGLMRATRQEGSSAQVSRSSSCMADSWSEQSCPANASTAPRSPSGGRAAAACRCLRSRSNEARTWRPATSSAHCAQRRHTRLQAKSPSREDFRMNGQCQPESSQGSPLPQALGGTGIGLQLFVSTCQCAARMLGGVIAGSLDAGSLTSVKAARLGMYNVSPSPAASASLERDLGVVGDDENVATASGCLASGVLPWSSSQATAPGSD
mmetsp:Transcript_52224/g.148890  ORF Transcript_52224/g.148890 Transcript_52224/m.148890 type:complete len:282 (+) Transcript_52224:250-1095(+)